MRKIVFCIGLFISLGIGRLSAQTVKPDPVNVTDRIVEYDYGRKLFLNILPFDDQFTLKISNLPADVSNLTISFYEVRGNYNLFSKKNNPNSGRDSISEAQFIALKKIKKYSVNTWTRNPGYDSTFAYIPIPFALAPNGKYVFSMNETRRSKLSESEKGEIHDVIIADARIASFVNSLAHSYANSNRPLRNTSGESVALTSMVNRVLKDYDAALQYVPPKSGLDSVQQKLKAFIEGVRGYYMKLNEVEKSFPPADTTDPAKTTITTVKRLVRQSADWWAIANDASRANDLKQTLARVDTTGFTGSQKLKLADVTEALDDAISSMSAIVDDLVNNYILSEVYRSTGLADTYFVNMVDQANFYIGLDIGYAYIGNFSRFAGYSGLNIYFRPVNKNIPLSRYKQVLDIITTRTSLLIGVTVESIAKTNVRKGIVGNNGIIVGAGVRLNSWFRINGGGLLYYKYDNNPIMNTDRYSTKASPFISASIDVDVQQLIGSLGTSIFKKPN